MSNATRGPRARNWCFTLNNYTDEKLTELSAIDVKDPQGDVEYIIFGKEVGESGTPHLQGFVVFKKRKRMTECITTIGQAHWSTTRMVENSIKYCKKEGDFIELGSAPKNTKQGRRTDLEDFKNDVKEGMRDMATIMQVHTQVAASYKSFVKDYLRVTKPEVVLETHPLRQWQTDLNEILNRPADKREIIFVVDMIGNTGKSWFARYYTSNHNAQIIIPSKKADMAYALEEDKRAYIFDCPRSKQGEFVQYDFLEEVKNGFVFSSKYESCFKTFATPHVVVLMNEMPQMDKLSVDRFKIITL